MTNPRIYGKAPYNIVVIHGGPGAPVARELSENFGVKVSGYCNSR